MIERIIQTESLTKRYGNFTAVKRLSCSVRSERITGFLGRNGAGKSSTIKMLLGMINPTSGSGTVLGLRIDNAEESLEMRRKVGYVVEDKGLYAYMTVAQLIWFTRSFYPDWQRSVEEKLLAQYRLPSDRKVRVELSRFLRQTVKSQNSSNGELTHGNVSTEVHKGSKSGGDSAAGWRGIDRRGGSGV